jgi:hypothetical protein
MSSSFHCGYFTVCFEFLQAAYEDLRMRDRKKIFAFYVTPDYN